jgi:hypothetical protein
MMVIGRRTYIWELESTRFIQTILYSTHSLGLVKNPRNLSMGMLETIICMPYINVNCGTPFMIFSGTYIIDEWSKLDAYRASSITSANCSAMIFML